LAMADYQNAMAQQATDKATTSNRVDQNTPWGSIDWKQDPKTGEWTQNTTLSPAEQKALESQQGIQQGLSNTAAGMLGGIGDTYSKPMDWSNLSAAGTPATAPGSDAYRMAGGQTLQTQADLSGVQGIPQADDATRQRVEDALYQRERARLDPLQEQQSKGLLDRLYAMGGREGDPGFDTQFGNLRTSQNAANQDAIYQSIIGGGQEQSRLFDMGSKAHEMGTNDAYRALTEGNTAKGQQFGIDTNQSGQWNDIVNQAYGNQRQSAADLTAERQRQAQEAITQRNQPLNEMNALLTGQQVGMPQFTGTPNTTAGTTTDPNYYGAFTDNQALRQGGGMMQQLMGLGGQLGGAAISKYSDRRLKSNIVRVGSTPAGYGIYEYDIFGKRERGVMAQEVPADWTSMDQNGFLMVDYARVR
jgi:hypothetical protein